MRVAPARRAVVTPASRPLAATIRAGGATLGAVWLTEPFPGSRSGKNCRVISAVMVIFALRFMTDETLSY
jgi:hypothetical protein